MRRLQRGTPSQPDCDAAFHVFDYSSHAGRRSRSRKVWHTFNEFPPVDLTIYVEPALSSTQEHSILMSTRIFLAALALLACSRTAFAQAQHQNHVTPERAGPAGIYSEPPQQDPIQ